jgi:hypothetical protein
MIPLNVYRRMPTRALRVVYHSIHYRRVTVYGHPMDFSPIPEPTSELPEIPECSVTRGRDGLLYLAHESGRTAHASTDREAVLAGLALRVLSSAGSRQRRRSPLRFIPPPWVMPAPEDAFRAGDPA